jgi:hypothetical protein
MKYQNHLDERRRERSTYTTSAEVGVGAEINTADRRCSRFLCVGAEEKSTGNDRSRIHTYARSRLDGVGGVKLSGSGDFAVPAQVSLPVVASDQTGGDSCGEGSSRKSSQYELYSEHDGKVERWTGDGDFAW